MPSLQFQVEAGGQLNGSLTVPGDKSISHRAIMLGSLAQGTSRVYGFLQGEDSLATLAAFRAMGVTIEGPNAAGEVIIEGVGLHGLKSPPGPLYLGNSGTSMRLLAGLLAGQNFSTELTGDESLSQRPMRRVITPLSQMQAHIDSRQGMAPLKISGKPLQGIAYTLPIASAQVKSCLLLAGLYAQGQTCITEPTPTRDHTERMLSGFGYPLQREQQTVCLSGGGTLTATDIQVPADISSAAFFMVGATIAPGSELVLTQVGMNPTRTGILHILAQMGADIEWFNEQTIGGEPIADIRIRSSRLRGIQIPEQWVSLAIDEFPALFIAAACAEGETVLTGAAELRVKESDRIQVMADGLQALGIDARPTPDGMIIQGGQLQGGHINSHGDHRIAMAFAIAALRATGTITIDDCANVNTSFPGFVTKAAQVGLAITATTMA